MKELLHNIGVWLMSWIVAYVCITSLVENKVLQAIYIIIFFIGYVLYLVGDRDIDL